MDKYLQISLCLENEAMQDSSEIARILEDYARKIRSGHRYPRAMMDINGNQVGRAEVIEK